MAADFKREEEALLTDDTAQKQSRSYILPVEDIEFLLRDEMRDMRFALEYSKAELLLRDWGIRSTIVVFGSARTPSPEQVEPPRAAAQTDAERRARRAAGAPGRSITKPRANSAASPRSAAAPSRRTTAGATT